MNEYVVFVTSRLLFVVPPSLLQSDELCFSDSIVFKISSLF